MAKAGPRDTLITFQRATTTTDGAGQSIETWADYAKEWAAVRYGSARERRERREASQLAANQTATFRMLANSKTRDLTPLDRIIGYLGGIWNITDVALITRAEVEVTAVRKTA